LRFGIDTFGASAPIDALYQHFGLTVDQIVPQITAKLDT
jgi:transketolase